jgi:Putative bacterial sensory transduction regulator
MTFREFAGAILIGTMTATTAFGQSTGVKGWTPQAPQPGDGATGPKTISRGPGQTPPQPPQPQPPQPPQPAGPTGPSVGQAPAGDFLIATDPAGLQRAMQNGGYRAELTTDDNGNPKIVGSASRSTYWVLFLDCDSSVGCLGVEFYVSYDMQTKPSLEQINQFNEDFRYIRASINQYDQPSMYMDVLIRDGGLSQDAFLEYVRLWHAIVPEFEKTINF